jgi:hypothetical protein
VRQLIGWIRELGKRRKSLPGASRHCRRHSSLAPRGTSGERARERGFLPWYHAPPLPGPPLPHSVRGGNRGQRTSVCPAARGRARVFP